MAYEDRPLMLSEATSGQGVLIVSVDPLAPTLIHTATADTALTDILELTVSNSHTASVQLTLFWGAINAANSITGLVEHQKFERQLTLPKPIRDGLTLHAYASVANVIRIWQAGGTCQLAVLPEV